MNNLKPFPKGFFYRDYYLLTLLNKKVVANQYVEGEWSEPGDEAYREVTSFKIDERYRISVQTKKLENGKETSTETHVFELRPDGHLSKTD